MKPTGSRSHAALSLVEVVLALGVASMALVSIVGLLSIGLTGVGNSEMHLLAANVTSSLLQQRLAAPGGTTGALANAPLPPLALASLPVTPQAAEPQTVETDAGGSVVAAAPTGLSGQAEPTSQASFKLTTRIWRDTTADPESRLVRIHFLLSWPPQAPANVAKNRYEVLTSALLDP